MTEKDDEKLIVHYFCYWIFHLFKLFRNFIVLSSEVKLNDLTKTTTSCCSSNFSYPDFFDRFSSFRKLENWKIHLIIVLVRFSLNNAVNERKLINEFSNFPNSRLASILTNFQIPHLSKHQFMFEIIAFCWYRAWNDGNLIDYREWESLMKWNLWTTQMRLA